jgi:hypothetical protein
LKDDGKSTHRRALSPSANSQRTSEAIPVNGKVDLSCIIEGDWVGHPEHFNYLKEPYHDADPVVLSLVMFMSLINPVMLTSVSPEDS